MTTIVGTRAADRGQRLDRRRALVEVAGRGGGLHHRVLAGDVVGGDREVEALAHRADHVEVGERRLDHQHVRSLGDVELALAERLADVARIHLVAAAVAERRRRACRLAERPVERRGVLGGVGDDRRLGQLGADRGDAAVHHVARADDVGAGLDVRDRGAREQLERGVVVDLLAAQDAAVAVRGVLAEADVGEQQQLGEAGRSARSACWTIPSAIQAPEPSSSFSSGMPKRITALTPARSSSSHSRTTPSTVRRDIAGSALVAERLGRDEERHHEVVERELVSRTRSRSAPVRRRRRSRVAGNELTPEGYGMEPVRSPAGDGVGLRHRLDLDRDRRRRPTTTRTRSARRRTPTIAARRRGAAARSARRSARRCSSPASRPKMTSSGCSRSALPITFGTTMWPSIWWIPRKSSTTQIDRERMDDERVDHRRDRAEPRAEVRQHLGQRHPRAEERARRSRRPGRSPVTPRIHKPSPALEPMIRLSAIWPADVRGERVLHPRDQRPAAVRREAPVDACGPAVCMSRSM